MGLFSRRSKREESSPAPRGDRPTIPIGGPVRVVGEENYPDAFVRITGGAGPEGYEASVVAVLQPEPENPHDPNAVAVLVAGEKVGYLGRVNAERYGEFVAAFIDRFGVAAAGAMIRGNDRGLFDVELWMNPDPSHVMAHTGTIHAVDLVYDDGAVAALCSYEVPAGKGKLLHGAQINPTRATLLPPVAGNVCKRCENW